MKKIFTPIAFAIFAFFAQSTTAQVDVTLNPFGLLFGDLSVGADFAISEKLSVEAAVGFGTNNVSDIKGTNFSVTAVPKFYFNPNRGADRFYADIFVKFVNRRWNYDEGSIYGDFTSTRFGLGFGLGYKVVSSGGFVFDIGFGAGRALVDNNKYDDSAGNQQDFTWIPIMIQGKLAVGYRFGGGKDK